MWDLFTWLFLYIAVPTGVAYLGGMLLTPNIKQPKINTEENAQSRSWNPRTTRQEGTPRPRAYGKNLHHGNIVAGWTDVDENEREIVYLVVEHGDGPTKGIVTPIEDNVFLNDQPASNFGDVSIQERIGTMDQTCMTGFEKTKLEYEVGSELIYGDDPIIFTTPNDLFDDIEFTLMLPYGLMKHYADGGETTGYITVKVRISEHGLDDWTEIFNEEITAKQTTPLFKLYKVNTLSPGYVVKGKQYDLEFTNLSPIKAKLTRAVYIKSVREVISIAFKRPGKALVGITAIATTQLSGNIDVKVIREDRLINVFDGSTWAIGYSRNRSWVDFDILTQPVISGSDPWTIERYEGINPSKLDINFFYAWAEFCSTQVADGYGGTEDKIACDIIVDLQTDIWTLANEIANIGRANLYWRGRILTGWIDTLVTDTVDLVTMDNIMARTWKNSWVGPADLAGAIEVFYKDSRQGYERVPAPLSNENAGTYTRTISVEGTGITTRGTAIHTANHLLERNRLIRNRNSFKQYKDAFRYRLGDVIKLQHKVPNWGHGYRVIQSEANNTIQLDRDATDEISAGDLLYIRSFDEVNQEVSIDVYTVESVDEDVVTIVETWSIDPIKNNICAVGIAGAIRERRIIKISPTTDNYFDITVETYNEELYDADELDPDNPDKNYIWPAPARQLVRPVTNIEVMDLISQVLPPRPDIEVPWLSNCDFIGNEEDTVNWEARDEDEPVTLRYRGETYEITPDETTDEFIYWDPNYTTTLRTTNLITVATAAGMWYVCRNVDGVAYPIPSFVAANIGVVLAGYLRVGTADIENLAVETIKIADNAVTFMVATFTAGESYWTPHGAWRQFQTLTIETTGAPVAIFAAAQWHAFSGAGMDIRIRRDDSDNVYFTNLYTTAFYGNPFCVAITDEPNAGQHTYTLDGLVYQPDVGNGYIYAKNRSLVAKEVKK